MGPFLPAEPSIPCMDRWPPNTFTKAGEQAYARQVKAGNITALRISQADSITAVHYLSNCPHQWILGQLRATASAAAVQITIGDFI